MAVDLPASPNNREEQYLASIAGQNVEPPACPWNRKEAYLNAIDGRIADLQDEIEELENNPDVADIVDTYADLEAYDTSTLTDKDIIRVLNDETHDGNSTYYKYSKATDSFTYIGSSKTYDVFTGTDGTTAGTKGLVPAPATTDAGKFLKADGTWDSAGGGGVFLVEFENTAGSSSYSTQTATEAQAAYNNGKVIVFFAKKYGLFIPDNYKDSQNFKFDRGELVGFGFAPSSSTEGGLYRIGAIPYDSSEDKFVFRYAPNADSFIQVSKDTSSTISGLSANPKIITSPTLKTLFNSVLIQNAGAPTTSTVGTVGMLLEDTTNGKLYQCTAVDNTDPQNPSYTWSEVGGSSINVVQTTGTSTTDVMSQNAVTGMVFADASTQYSVRIGYGSENDSQQGIALGMYAKSKQGANLAIGRSSYAKGNGAVAIGPYSNAATVGQMDIGSTQTSYGYNSSNYRLLTGVYDGQNAHDAATVGQLPAVLTNSDFNSILENA